MLCLRLPSLMVRTLCRLGAYNLHVAITVLNILIFFNVKGIAAEYLDINPVRKLNYLKEYDIAK